VMIKKHVLISAIVAAAMLVIAVGIYAKVVPDEIELRDDAYTEYTKGVVMFTHKKHQTDYAQQYPDLYKSGCGECHHDKDGKPLTELKEGDDVQRCIECHQKPGEQPKGKDAPKLSKTEKLEYHAYALHENCKGCHKKFNKQYKPKKAPTTCAGCHPGAQDEQED
jgi:cytochrome c553